MIGAWIRVVVVSFWIYSVDRVSRISRWIHPHLRERIIQGFWPKQLEEWSCHLLRGENIRSSVLDLLNEMSVRHLNGDVE